MIKINKNNLKLYICSNFSCKNFLKACTCAIAESEEDAINMIIKDFKKITGKNATYKNFSPMTEHPLNEKITLIFPK